MTARDFTLYLFMTAGGLIGVRWGVLAAVEIVRGVNAAPQAATPKGEVGHE